MHTETISFIGAGQKALPGILWTPDTEPCITLQVIHGMTEHMGRYAAAAEMLTAHGIAVAGFDLRGHGRNEGDQVCATFGEGGWQDSLEDIRLFRELLRQRFPGAASFMLGFSLGSFLLRDFLSHYPDKPDGAIIMGTGDQPGLLLRVLLKVIQGEIKRGGFDHSTPRVQQMSFENYNKRFAPNQTPFDWLCADEGQLALYARDTLCRKEISSGLFYQLVDAMRRTGSAQTYQTWQPDMPVLLLSGAEDPVGDSGKGAERVHRAMLKAGLSDVEMHLLPQARHDLLHEISSGASAAALDTVVQWLFAKAGS